MATTLRRFLPALVATVLIQAPLPAQVATAWANCKQDALSLFNCASYYSGTVTRASDLTGPSFHQTETVTATVTAGKVTCRTRSSENGDFEGPGLVAVTHKNTANAGGYEIEVYCPEGPGEQASRDGGPSLEVRDQTAADYATLEGRDSYEHSDADAANGVAGTQTITWNLRRN